LPLVSLTSLDDPRLETFRHLKDTNRTRWTGRFIAEGEKLVRRLLASDFPIESVLLSERFVPQWQALLPPDLPVLVVPDELVEPLVGFNFHRGILACGRRKPPVSLAELLPLDKAVTLVVCPEVQDPENLGSILRLAAAFDVEGVLVGQGSADPFSRRVLRVSMGAALRVPVVESHNIEANLRQIAGPLAVELLATVLDPRAEPLASAARPKRLALLLGSEGHGLRSEWIAACARRITIPMPGEVDSLNVAVAAGIFLYHFCCASRGTAQTQS
jgi:tRNA G18 (ribose-2'-O)-methylase SpoU